MSIIQHRNLEGLKALITGATSGLGKAITLRLAGDGAAVVVHGLNLARGNDIAIVPGVIDRGVNWLKGYQAEQVQRLKNAPSNRHPLQRRTASPAGSIALRQFMASRRGKKGASPILGDRERKRKR